jgi:DNA-binding MarR family transcriptional regulator
MHADREEAPTTIPRPSIPLPPEQAARVGYLLGRNAAIWQQHANEVLADSGLTVKHFGCLRMITSSEEPLSQLELGRRTGMDRTTMVSIVDELERAGYVKRERNPHDRRAYALVATKAGEKWFAEALEILAVAESELLAPLSMAERRKLVDLLQRLLVG